MTRSRLGLMGLCAVIFGVMAMSASSAQAGFSWLVLNSAGTVNTEVTESGGVVNLLAAVVGESDTNKDLTLLTKALGLSIIVTCGSFELININLEALGKLSNGQVKFKECEAYKVSPLTEPLDCMVHSSGQAVGTILSDVGKGELVLHEVSPGVKEVLTKIESTTAQFATILMELCALPASNKITGVLYLKDNNGKATTHEEKHLIVQGPLTSLNYGTNMTTEHLETAIDGSAWIKLGGAHAGLKWAGMDV
jgi:hypothetical protein